MQCPFCDSNIITKQSLYENENVVVLHNIRPANKGQCVVFPKRHTTNIRELSKQEIIDLILAVQLVSSRYAEHLKPVGFNYGFNEGEYAGQTVQHFHFHIIPRLDGDKTRLPEYHLFHRDPKTKHNLTDAEIEPFVEELRRLFP